MVYFQRQRRQLTEDQRQTIIYDGHRRKTKRQLPSLLPRRRPLSWPLIVAVVHEPLLQLPTQPHLGVTGRTPPSLQRLTACGVQVHADHILPFFLVQDAVPVVIVALVALDQPRAGPPGGWQEDAHQGVADAVAEGGGVRGDGVQGQVLRVALVVAAEEGDDGVGEEQVESEGDEGGGNDGLWSTDVSYRCRVPRAQWSVSGGGVERRNRPCRRPGWPPSRRVREALARSRDGQLGLDEWRIIRGKGVCVYRYIYIYRRLCQLRGRCERGPDGVRTAPLTASGTDRPGRGWKHGWGSRQVKAGLIRRSPSCSSSPSRMTGRRRFRSEDRGQHRASPVTWRDAGRRAGPSRVAPGPIGRAAALGRANQMRRGHGQTHPLTPSSRPRPRAINSRDPAILPPLSPAALSVALFAVC
ncbi:hypothetical protein VTN02DRAFT_6192 [Thermoascus thermophilus]